VLRNARESQRITQEQVASAMEWSPAKIMRIESGGSFTSTSDLRALLLFYHVDYDDDLAQLARMARRRPWWTQYRAWIPRPTLLAAAMLEEGLVARCFSSTVVPTVLATDAYIRAIAARHDIHGRAPDLTAEFFGELQRRVLTPELDLQVVLDEAVIRRRIGDPLTRREQLRRLIDLSELLPISLRVLPFSSGLGGLINTFTAIEVDGEVVVLDEGPRRGVLLEDAEAQRYTDDFARLYAASLTSTESTALIASVLAD
jgi:transcriptional regulator with XRE-family HTH domain